MIDSLRKAMPKFRSGSRSILLFRFTRPMFFTWTLGGVFWATAGTTNGPPDQATAQAIPSDFTSEWIHIGLLASRGATVNVAGNLYITGGSGCTTLSTSKTPKTDETMHTTLLLGRLE